MASVQRRLKRTPVEQATEVERVRALTLQRLAGLTEADRPQTVVAPDRPGDADTNDHTDDNDHPEPSEAAATARTTTADEAIDVTDHLTQGSDTKARKPLAFRIAGLNDPAAPTAVETEPEPTPLVMFLGAPGPTWPSDQRRPAVEDASTEGDQVERETLFADAPEDLEPVTSTDAAQPVAAEVAPPPPDEPPVVEAAVAVPPVVAAAVAPARAPAVVVEASAYCPYCATILQPPPSSDRPCAQCRQQIVVRQVDDRTVWLMEAALPVFEAERRRIADEARWTASRAYWLDLARATGAPKAKLTKAAEEAPTEDRVNAARDLYLTSVDRWFEAVAKDGQWSVAAQIRYDQALVLFELAGTPAPANAGGDHA